MSQPPFIPMKKWHLDINKEGKFLCGRPMPNNGTDYTAFTMKIAKLLRRPVPPIVVVNESLYCKTCLKIVANQ